MPCPVGYIAPSSIGKRYPIVNEVSQTIATVKRHLKAQGLTYRDVAAALKLSEASEKVTWTIKP